MQKIVCVTCGKVFYDWACKKRKYCSCKCMFRHFTGRPRPYFTGKKNPFYGRKHTAKTKKAMSKKAIKRVQTNGLPWTGKPRTKEQIEKWRQSVKGKMPSGEKHHRWKGGIAESGYGYVLVKTPSRGYVPRSHLVMEKAVGRILTAMEVVHHINGIKDDDRIENLILFPSKSAHVKHHWDSGCKFGR